MPTLRDSAPDIDTTENAFPWTQWGAVSNAVDKAWDPLNNPHHLVVGGTGSGKSYLTINGILKPMCSANRVLIVDTKGDDPVTSSVGKPVRELPRNTWYKGLESKRKPMQDWFRLVAHDDNDKAREQVGSTLLRCIKEGNWVIYLDEAVEVCDPQRPNLGQAPVVSLGLKKGRSRRVPIISATQAPVWVPRWLIDQASFVWIGRIRDEDRHKRLIQVGGMRRQDLPYLTSLQKREWLLAADPLDIFYRTTVEGVSE